MGMYDTWPDPSLRMKNPDDAENAPASAPPSQAAPPDPAAERARKAVRARALTDPLGAMGQRDSRLRIAREGRARRLATIGAAVSFAGSLGFITWNAHLSSNGGGGSVDSPGVALAESGNASMVVIDPSASASATTAPSSTAASSSYPVALSVANRASGDEHEGDDDDHDDDHSATSRTLPASNASSSTSTLTVSSSSAAAPTPAPSTSHVTSHSS